jgi:hypothetical protein
MDSSKLQELGMHELTVTCRDLDFPRAMLIQTFITRL